MLSPKVWVSETTSVRSITSAGGGWVTEAGFPEGAMRVRCG